MNEITPEIEKRIEDAERGTMSVGITGTKEGLTEEQFSIAKDLFGVLWMTEIHAGDCVGVDAEIVTLVKELQPSVKTVGHPPTNPDFRAFLEYDEERSCKPYLKRNHDIVNESEYMFAFPKETKEVRRSGTWATVRYARKVGKQVLIIYPDGTVAA